MANFFLLFISKYKKNYPPPPQMPLEANTEINEKLNFINYLLKERKGHQTQ